MAHRVPMLQTKDSEGIPTRPVMGRCLILVGLLNGPLFGIWCKVAMYWGAE